MLDALLTLLKMRGEYQRALRLGMRLFGGEIVTIAWGLPDDIRQAWTILQRYQDTIPL